MHDARHAVDVAECLSGIVAARRRRAVEPDRASNGDARAKLATAQRVAIGGEREEFGRHVAVHFTALPFHSRSVVCDAGGMSVRAREQRRDQERTRQRTRDRHLDRHRAALERHRVERSRDPDDRGRRGVQADIRLSRTTSARI